jgi:predicted nucleic acid-binding protein
MAVRYWESSAVVAALLENDSAAAASLNGPGHRITSSLTIAEVRRALVRARHRGVLTGEAELRLTSAALDLLQRCETIDVTRAILERVARPFAREPIRTLDAIHVATIEMAADDPRQTTVVTRDNRVRDNARALGCLVE